MATITLYAEQKKRHGCTEQIFGLCGRRRGCDVLRACVLGVKAALRKLNGEL